MQALRACDAFGRKCDNCGSQNHFTKQHLQRSGRTMDEFHEEEAVYNFEVLTVQSAPGLSHSSCGILETSQNFNLTQSLNATYKQSNGDVMLNKVTPIKRQYHRSIWRHEVVVEWTSSAAGITWGDTLHTALLVGRSCSPIAWTHGLHWHEAHQSARF